MQKSVGDLFYLNTVQNRIELNNEHELVNENND